jgi:hypothetical protein
MTNSIEKLSFVCACEERARSACTNLPFVKIHENNPYCALHYPGRDKFPEFLEIIKAKISVGDYDFQGAWFPTRVSFVNYSFKKDASFRLAVFNDEADFFGVTFEGEANFSMTTFAKVATFQHATFKKKANFVRTKFMGETIFLSTAFDSRALFNVAVFNEAADFSGASFNIEANFLGTTFRSHAKFFGALGDPVMFPEGLALSLSQTQTEKQGRISFHSISLRPHWFINADARAFDFINVSWIYRSISEDVASIKQHGTHKLLSIAYRQLAENAENTHRYEEASRFRYMAMDAQRQEKRKGFAIWKLHWWYWLASGYGERIGRALLSWIVILLVFGALYTRVGFNTSNLNVPEASFQARDKYGAPLSNSQALLYSFEVMILQKPEPRPLTQVARLLVGMETVLGPLQAALLALAIRRKFMR